ncbi:MAG TPA: MBL fold metallo-hydrolase [Thermoanaerobaculia bacterium]|nr:MBL fold metallo-hydrolase [Thermoanaerobaculia bacterium]
MPQLTETQLRENVFVWTLGGEEIPTSYGANCTAVAGRRATLLVDPLIAPAHARLVGDAAARAGLPPIRWIALTHHHTDHALGASWFAARGAAVVAHEACGRGMEAAHPGLIAERRRVPALAGLFADAEPYVPTLTFSDRLAVDLGGVRAEIFHPGPGHTAGDAVIHVPDASLVVCGDLVSNGYHVNFEDADLAGFERSLGRLLDRNAAAYVPGHGDPGGPEIVEAQRRYFGSIRKIVGEASAESAEESIRRAFPGFRLGIVLGDTVRRFSES